MFDRQFVFVGVRRTWSEDRAFFLDDNGVRRSLPVGWTDAAEPDLFIEFAAGRSPFRLQDLLELAALIDRLSRPL